MELVYGTKNSGKLQHMKDMVQGLDLQIIGLEDATQVVIGIEETGNNPLDNARIKSLAYYDLLKRPVFSCDSGLYVERLVSPSGTLYAI